MAEERLQKVLARAGIASRRACEEIITAGRVEVNGKVVRELGVKVVLGRDRVRVDGKQLPREPRAYLIFHKPPKVVTTLDDPEGRETVASYLPKDAPRVYPVGRLDWDTAGVLLLTNDGDLANRLMHPRHEVPKVYRAKVKGPFAPEALFQLLEGVELEDGPASAGEAKVVSEEEGKVWIRLTLHEGRNRQVKRMFEAVGYPVIKLRRDSFAGLTTKGVRTGHLRVLTLAEVQELRSSVGLPSWRQGAKRGAQLWKPSTSPGQDPDAAFDGRQSARRPQSDRGRRSPRRGGDSSRSSAGRSRSTGRAKPKGRSGQGRKSRGK